MVEFDWPSELELESCPFSPLSSKVSSIAVVLLEEGLLQSQFIGVLGVVGDGVFGKFEIDWTTDKVAFVDARFAITGFFNLEWKTTCAPENWPTTPSQ
jgi:hypothetical protein